MDPAIPWYKSGIIVGILVSLFFKALYASGLVSELAPADAEQVSNALILVIGGLGDLWALRGRVTQTSAPVITASKSRAAALSAEATPVYAEASEVRTSPTSNTLVVTEPQNTTASSWHNDVGTWAGQAEAMKQENL